MGTAEDSKKTRARLIEAAGRLFAERGFAGAKVRDIVEAANLHLSAMNYHFGSKEGLYREVVREACQFSSIPSQARKQLLEGDPYTGLHHVVASTLEAYSASQEGDWQSAILAWELWKPSSMFEEIVREHLEADTKVIAQLVASATNTSPESEGVQFAVLTFFGLLDALRSYERALDTIAPQITTSQRTTNDLASRIVNLVLAAATTPTQRTGDRA